ncbi:MAG TPA: arsinothricin resistance N-acetyltransferase ArsN1 family B [Vicinamibacteria bacterium]|nr:arsinothricin resistance N-acetyltransferase ArsN1 family B [Vicinamibacteria bacterium]
MIRLARDTDAGPMLEIYAPLVRETPISFELAPPSVEEFRERVRKITARTPWLVCEADGEIQGYAYAGPFRARPAYQWAVETTVYVAAPHRGKGVARALYTALLTGLRLAGYYRAYAGITLPNPASVATHERLGFEPVGVFKEAGFKLGHWHDVGFWQLALQGATADPAQPRPLPEVEKTTEWQGSLRAAEAGLR